MRATHFLVAAQAARCRIRLAVTPLRRKLSDPISAACLQTLGSERFSVEFQTGRDAELDSLI